MEENQLANLKCVRKGNYLKKWTTVAFLAIMFTGLAGCAGSQPTPAQVTFKGVSRPLSEQFDMVNKDGVEIACPKQWHSAPDPSLVYCVSRSDYIRITVGVLSAFPQSFYDGLVKRGTVTESVLHGYSTYMNEYPYDYQNHQLISRCITVIEGGRPVIL